MSSAKVLALSLVLVLAVPLGASAVHTEFTGTVTVVDPTFGAYTAIKTVQVFADSEIDNPFPVPGNFTYVYMITNDPSSQVSLIGFATPVPNLAAVVGAGFVDGAGVEPSATDVLAFEVHWRFFTDTIDPGETSEKLYLVSPYGPDEVQVTVNGDFSLDAQAPCFGPVVTPAPVACTIGFWKNRQDGKKGLLKFYPDGDFGAVKAEAVALSSVFATEAELIAALTSSGSRPMLERAKQQLAALVLNIAAGNLFPGNTKCRLFHGTGLDTNGDGLADTTVGQALATIESNILSGNAALIEAAHKLADDINNGIGVIGSTQFS